MRFLSRLKSSWQRFQAARSGNVAMMFGLTLLPVTLAIGCAIDISRVLNAKSRLLAAVDATGLAVALVAASSSSTEATRQAHAFFYANFPDEGLGTVSTLTVSELPNRGGVQINAKSTVPTSFMALAGVEDIEVTASSEITREARALELTLVLDTTASMQGTKISTLKTAATSLINQMITSDAVKIAIVPFAQYVNIGLSNRAINGVSVPANSTSCSTTNKTVTTCTGTETYQSTCTRQINPRPGTCMVDGSPLPCTVYDTQSYSCTKTRSTGCTSQTVPTTTCTSQTWQGCVGSRPPPLNVSDTGFSTPLPGIMNISCSTPLTTLTQSASALRSAITALTASGNTYIPAGLDVGWHVMSPRIPFEQAAPDNANPKPRRVMLLMTDGTNSASISGTGPLHNGTSRTAADQVTNTLCTNIKADGIEIYTVAFQITDTATKDMIRNCASSADFYFDASDPTKLEQAFAAIATGLSTLRISK